MLELDIPNFGAITIQHLVCDYNGTLAVDGRLPTSVKEQLNRIAELVTVHVITADTFGLAQRQLLDVNCTLTILPKEDQSAAKQDYVQRLGAEQTVAIGNGRNDRLMLQTAVIGIAVLLDEGAAIQTIQSADILCPGIHEALAYFEEPRRLIATLRG